MTKRLKHVAPVQCGIVLGALYGAIALIFVPFILLITLVAPKQGNGAGILAGGAFLVILFPVIYGVLGFVGGIIAASIYNLIASWTGGIELTLADCSFGDDRLTV
jgi:hypothetical protein